MSTFREDFGNGDSESVSLVPDSLRAYRHFVLYKDTLQPVNSDIGTPSPYTRRVQIPGMCDCSSCQMYGPSYDHFMRMTTTDLVFKAECTKRTAVQYAHGAFGLSVDVSGALAAHSAPQPECSCGFYAHYGQDGDFYPSQKWDAFRADGKYLECASRDSCYDSYYDPYYDPDYDPSRRPEFAMVRAVVELTGRTVLGTKGARAEKMKIIALALDWSKFENSDETHTAYDNLYDLYPPDLNSLRYTTGWARRRMLTRETMSEGTRRLYRAADLYGVKAYDSIEAMHRAYPQPDISHLLPTDGEA